MTAALYLYLMLQVPIPFHTGDSELDWQLHLMTHEASIRERRLQSCLLNGDILIIESKIPYKPMPLRLKVTQTKCGRELT